VSEERIVLPDEAPVGAALGEHQAADHDRRPTDAQLLRDDVAEPHFDVEPAQGVLEVTHQRFDLQDQERASG